MSLFTTEIQKHALGIFSIPAPIATYEELDDGSGVKLPISDMERLGEERALYFYQLVRKVFDDVAAPSLGIRFDKMMKLVHEGRYKEGMTQAATLTGAINDSAKGILGRINGNFIKTEDGEEVNDSITFINPRIFFADGEFPISSLSILEKYRDGDPQMGGVATNELFSNATEFLKQLHNGEIDGTVEQDFMDLLTIMMKDEWFQSLFIDHLRYKTPPLSYSVSSTLVTDMYEKRYETVDDVPFESPEEAANSYEPVKIIRAMANEGRIGKGDRVLDLGAGIGISTKLLDWGLRGLGVHVIGIDRYKACDVNEYYDWNTGEPSHPFSIPAHHFLAGDEGHIQFLVSSAIQEAGGINVGLPFADGSIKVVVLGEVFQHISDNKVGIFLSEVERVLSDDGVTIVQSDSHCHEYRKYGESARLNTILDEIRSLLTSDDSSGTQFLQEFDKSKAGLVEFVLSLTKEDFKLFMSGLSQLKYYSSNESIKNLSKKLSETAEIYRAINKLSDFKNDDEGKEALLNYAQLSYRLVELLVMLDPEDYSHLKDKLHYVGYSLEDEDEMYTSIARNLLAAIDQSELEGMADNSEQNADEIVSFLKLLFTDEERVQSLVSQLEYGTLKLKEDLIDVLDEETFVRLFGEDGTK